MPTPAHWDIELKKIETYTSHFATAHKATAVISVAVDTGVKRDYFIPRLQTLVDTKTWAAHLEFKVVPMNGDDVVIVKKGTR